MSRNLKLICYSPSGTLISLLAQHNKENPNSRFLVCNSSDLKMLDIYYVSHACIRQFSISAHPEKKETTEHEHLIAHLLVADGVIPTPEWKHDVGTEPGDLEREEWVKQVFASHQAIITPDDIKHEKNRLASVKQGRRMGIWQSPEAPIEMTEITPKPTP